MGSTYIVSTYEYEVKYYYPHLKGNAVSFFTSMPVISKILIVAPLSYDMIGVTSVNITY